MKLSKRGEYALKAATVLGERYGRGVVHLHEISKQEHIPLKFLESIMQDLKRARIVTSTKGRSGGYELSQDPRDVTIGWIVRVVDGPLAPMSNREELEKKLQSVDRHQAMYEMLLKVRHSVADILDKTTLSNLIDREQELNEARTGGFVMAGI